MKSGASGLLDRFRGGDDDAAQVKFGCSSAQHSPDLALAIAAELEASMQHLEFLIWSCWFRMASMQASYCTHTSSCQGFFLSVKQLHVAEAAWLLDKPKAKRLIIFGASPLAHAAPCQQVAPDQRAIFCKDVQSKLHSGIRRAQACRAAPWIPPNSPSRMTQAFRMA